MSEQQQTEVVETEVVDNSDLPKEAGEANLATRPSTEVNLGTLQDLGFITPIASPEHLRAAFDFKQKMFSAILADTDYLYTVNWQNGTKREQRVLSNHSEAMALAEKFANLGARLNAKPKKSGIVKLARALGVTAIRSVQKGLPNDPVAQYSYVEYEAIHEGTGKREIGVGWCDKGERGGKITTHDVIATADTRAYNRAVLRLAGFGDVSADEIIAGVSDTDDVPVTVPEPAKAKQLEDVPSPESDEVTAASRAWAEAVLKRSGERFAAAAQQDTRSARELRAKARRGSTRAAHALGGQGLRWEGTASDGLGYPTFHTGAPPVSIEQIAELQQAAAEAKDKSADMGSSDAAEQPGEAWNLSGKGSDKDDEPEPAPADTVDKDGSIPGPSPSAETITTKQAKNVSTLLKQIFDTKDEMLSWLKVNCHVDSSIHIRSNQYEPIMKSLKKRAEDKESESNG